MEDHPEFTNQQVLEYLFEELLELGVEEFCIAAGARNAPIISALYAEGSVATKLYHFFDERSAAFFALGRIIASQKPVAVVTTSGTAVAELLPATIEAYFQAQPLVLVSADRPSSYRGSGAPQAIEQKRIFEPYVGIRRDIEFREGSLQIDRWEAKVSGSLPQHFNVCLEECVVEHLAYRGTLRNASFNLDEVPSPEAEAALCEFLSKSKSQPLVVLVGGLSATLGESVSDFLLSLGAPVLAEDTANLTWSPALRSLRIQGGESTLSSFSPKLVLRIGAVPSWRFWRDLEANPDVEVLNFAVGSFSGLARSSKVTTYPIGDPQWWRTVSINRDIPTNTPVPVDLEYWIDSLIQKFPRAEPSLLIEVSRQLPAQNSLFLGNSLTIRYWNKLCVALGNPRTTYANRGANGIDGLLSTWLGVGSQDAVSAVILGDLSALYDLSAPYILPQLPQDSSRFLIVVNNGGGKIFASLPWLKKVPEQTRSAFENTHQIRFESWASMWNAPYEACRSIHEIWLDLPSSAPLKILELLPDADQTQQFFAELEAIIQGSASSV